MKTLLIDDDPFALKLLALQLEQLGCAPVTLCESAQSAQTLLESEFETIGLVFCDLQMPDVARGDAVRTERVVLAHAVQVSLGVALARVGAGEHDVVPAVE